MAVTQNNFERCNNNVYNYKTLPQTSIIICFTEESWSTLLRTVHSVINRSPPQLLKEIILVDDFSKREYLKTPLDVYMKRFPKVKILHLPSRQGLIRARLAGVEIAEGPVLTFLDSHVECSVGWLEPQLAKIADDYKTVVCPIIDSISSASFGYGKVSKDLIGGFNWALGFTWISEIIYPLHRRHEPKDPLRSPAMAGGLFSINKQYFYELGLYDEGLKIWGGENIELSLKIWLCGGTLLILPCSHVGHVFRAKQPYDFAGENNVKVYLENSQRVAEVWLDQYKELFYLMRPSVKKHKVGDLSKPKEFRSSAKCQDFQWYLDNVFTTLYRPSIDNIKAGRLQNVKYKRCVDHGNGGKLTLYPCHDRSSNQYFALTRQRRLESIKFCLVQRNEDVMVSHCTYQISTWVHSKENLLVEQKTSQCLTACTVSSLCMRDCAENRPEMQWTIDPFFYS